MPTLSIAKDGKAPVGTVGKRTLRSPNCQFRSDGDTVPFIATAAHLVGGVVVRKATNQAIGIVQALAHCEDAAATVGDEIQLRIQGMFWGPKGTVALADGARVKWATNQQWFEAHVSGPHEIVGGYDAGDLYALVRINVPNEDVVGTVSVSPSASPSASASPSSSAS